MGTHRCAGRIAGLVVVLALASVSLFGKHSSAIEGPVTELAGAVVASGRNIPKDLSTVRGFDYTPAVASGHRWPLGMWLNYDPAQVERELGFAKRLNLNQARVFVMYDAYAKDKGTLLENLVRFVRACHQRDIGVMVVVDYSYTMIEDEAGRQLIRKYAADLVKTLANEPGLEFWDVTNEPDWPPTPQESVRKKIASARYMAGLFHELDAKTPVTVGTAFVPAMEELADCVDVLSWHDYSPTRGQIRANIERAQAFAAKVSKPIFNTEIGAVGRANPYDVALQEFMNAGMGWYIWELTILPEGWGSIQGVFYPDGTVRDPTIVAAMLGFFRNRGPDIVPSEADKEGWVTKVVTNSKKWLSQPAGTWKEGLDLAEEAANLLESGELIAMREPPTRHVDLMRKGQPDLPALRALLQKYIEILEPYELKK